MDNDKSKNNLENKTMEERHVMEAEENEEEEDELSSNDAFDNVSMGETTLDFVGYVGLVEARKLVPGYDYCFAFELNNLTGRKCRVVAWGEELSRKVELIVRTRDVLHITKAKATAYKNSINNTPVHYYMKILDETEIKILKTNLKIQIEKQFFENLKLISIEDVGKHMGQAVRVEGYMKTLLETLIIEKNGTKMSYGIGSIGFKEHKLEIRINTYQNNVNILKGQKS